MDDSSELYLTLKYGSLDNALAKWLTQSEPFSTEEQTMLMQYCKTILPDLTITREADGVWFQLKL